MKSLGTEDALPLVYQQIKTRLLSELSARWPKGSRLPPVKQLAEQLNAGKSNTHRAIRELVREGVLVSRPGRGTFVAAAPRATPHQPGGQRTSTGNSLRGRRLTIVRYMQDSFIYAAVDALAEQFTALGGSVTWASDAMGHTPAIVAAQRSDAVVLVNPNALPPVEAEPAKIVNVLTTAQEEPVPLSHPHDVVMADSEQGGFLAGQWIRRIGCESVYFLGVYPKYLGERIDSTSAARLKGFEMGYGAAIPESLRFRAHSYQTTFGARAAARFVTLNPRPQGVFAASDDMALGFIHGALSHGLQPGVDYQLIGFDGQLRCRTGSDWPLTTIEVPMERLGRMAGQLLIERLADPAQPTRRVLLGGTLFEGATAVPSRIRK